jgi:hypothetical protein
MLKSVNNIYKQKRYNKKVMKLKMSFKENVVGGLKIWEYFRTRFAEARPLGYWR